MFHLLVSSSGWSDTGGTMRNDRIYIGRDSSFYANGKLDIAQIGKIPALLVTEPGINGPQLVKVARIIDITEDPRETTIRYVIDNSIPSILNIDLEKYPIELDLAGFGLNHTCWKLCKADLFWLLLTNLQKNSITPKVFSFEPAHLQNANLVSVMMPFKQEMSIVYSALQAACNELGLKCVRADDIWEHDAIIQDIVNLITRARVVICDCSGKNPNVFYEAGIAHAIGKEVILITQSADDVPFDLQRLRYIRYLANNEGCKSLSEAVKARLKTIIGL